MRDLRPGSPLRVARVKSGWKLGALAAKVGLTPNGLYRIETEIVKQPKLATRKAIAKALGVAESTLF